MSETTEPDALVEIMVFEAAAFRVGQVARNLLAEHPGLPAERVEPTAWVLPNPLDGPVVTAVLDIMAGSVDGVRAWATALGVEATVTISTSGPWEAAHAKAVVNGVTVKVMATRSLTGDEYVAWSAPQDQAATEPAEAVPGGGE